MKNVTTFGKLIGLLFFCLPLLFLLSINMYKKQQQGMSSLALEWEPFFLLGSVAVLLEMTF